MDENKKEQIEALEVLDMFNDKLTGNIKILINELTIKRREDTDELLKSVLDSINWEIQVINATLDVLNADGDNIKKDEFNKTITALGASVAEKDDAKMAECFKDAVLMFEKIGETVKKVLSSVS